MQSLKSAAAAAAVAVLIACSSSAQQATRLSPNDIVAKVGSQSITLAEVDDRALQRSSADFGGAKLVQALYSARRVAIEEIVSERLMDQEAKSRGIDNATLIEKEISSAVTTPSEADITFWYQNNPARVQGAALTQVHDAIKGLLIQERMSAAHDAFVDRLKTKTAVAILLEPPRQKIEVAGHPDKGPKDAPVEVVEFSDFQCPFCQRANPTVQQVLKTYGDKIHFVYRHYPLPNHPHARPAAEASACAAEQGRFWQYHDELFRNPNRLTNADLKNFADAVGLDTAQFNDCFDKRRFKSKVDKDLEEGNAAGISGTPAFFINGRSLDGAQPFESFKSIIDEELASKK